MKLARRPRRIGIAMIYVLVIASVLFGFAAMAVDLGMIMVTKTELQSTIDSASLAGVSGLSVSPAEARKRAKDMAKLNKVNGKPFILLDTDIEMGSWNSVTKTMTLLTGANESK